MSVLEQLSPLVSLCQACGFMPYTVEYDPITKSYSKFSFSVKNRVTWWFIFTWIFQFLVYPLPYIHFTKNVLADLAFDKTMPITVSLLGAVVVCSFLLQYGIARFIVLFRYKQLRDILDTLRQVESLFKHTLIIRQDRSVFKRAVWCCLFLVLLSVSFDSYALQLWFIWTLIHYPGCHYHLPDDSNAAILFPRLEFYSDDFNACCSRNSFRHNRLHVSNPLHGKLCYLSLYQHIEHENHRWSNKIRLDWKETFRPRVYK